MYINFPFSTVVSYVLVRIMCYVNKGVLYQEEKRPLTVFTTVVVASLIQGRPLGPFKGLFINSRLSPVLKGDFAPGGY